MGVPLIKYTCTINNEVLLTNLEKIEALNVDYNFLILETIPQELINQFLEQQEIIKNHLKETYDEEIDLYIVENLNNLNLNNLNSSLTYSLIKRFAIITNNNNKIVARLDCTIQGTTVRLETLYVSPESRGRNFGSWLVGKLILNTKEEFSQIKLFETNTDEHNDNALRILKKYNFLVKYTIEQLIQNRKK